MDDIPVDNHDIYSRDLIAAHWRDRQEFPENPTPLHPRLARVLEEPGITPHHPRLARTIRRRRGNDARNLSSWNDPEAVAISDTEDDEDNEHVEEDEHGEDDEDDEVDGVDQDDQDGQDNYSISGLSSDEEGLLSEEPSEGEPPMTTEERVTLEALFGLPAPSGPEGSSLHDFWPHIDQFDEDSPMENADSSIEDVSGVPSLYGTDNSDNPANGAAAAMDTQTFGDGMKITNNPDEDALTDHENKNSSGLPTAMDLSAELNGDFQDGTYVNGHESQLGVGLESHMELDDDNNREISNAQDESEGPSNTRKIPIQEGSPPLSREHDVDQRTVSAENLTTNAHRRCGGVSDEHIHNNNNNNNTPLISSRPTFSTPSHPSSHPSSSSSHHHPSDTPGFQKNQDLCGCSTSNNRKESIYPHPVPEKEVALNNQNGTNNESIGSTSASSEVGLHFVLFYNPSSNTHANGLPPPLLQNLEDQSRLADQTAMDSLSLIPVRPRNRQASKFRTLLSPVHDARIPARLAICGAPWPYFEPSLTRFISRSRWSTR